MTTPLQPEILAADPDRITETVDFNGKPITFRALRANDGDCFGRYLEALSEATERCFRPHALTMEAARELCRTIDQTQTLRLIATTGGPSAEKAIAYFILTLGVRKGEIDRFRRHGIALNSETDCVFAPSVADAYQNRGLGSALAPRVLALARRLGYTRMILQGGTQKPNYRGIHFYEKLGFQKVGDFITTATRDGKPVTIENQDMLLQL